MSEPFESSDPAPDPAPTQPPAGRPAQPENPPRGSGQLVPARRSPPSPAGRRRGTRHHARMPARTPVACRPSDLPPPVMHYLACGSGSPAGAAPAGKPRGCFGPTFYDACPAVTPGPRAPS
jgi:hypothetical protein